MVVASGFVLGAESFLLRRWDRQAFCTEQHVCGRMLDPEDAIDGESANVSRELIVTADVAAVRRGVSRRVLQVLADTRLGVKD
jgi:hypothetical protein